MRGLSMCMLIPIYILSGIVRRTIRLRNFGKLGKRVILQSGANAIKMAKQRIR